MKIIKKPDISDWSFQHTCIGCDCVLEVEEKDITYYSDSREGCVYYMAYCQVCGTRFNISEKDVPKLVRVLVKKRMSERNTRSYYDK